MTTPSEKRARLEAQLAAVAVEEQRAALQTRLGELARQDAVRMLAELDTFADDQRRRERAEWDAAWDKRQRIEAAARAFAAEKPAPVPYSREEHLRHLVMLDRYLDRAAAAAENPRERQKNRSDRTSTAPRCRTRGCQSGMSRW